MARPAAPLLWRGSARSVAAQGRQGSPRSVRGWVGAAAAEGCVGVTPGGENKRALISASAKVCSFLPRDLLCSVLFLQTSRLDYVLPKVDRIYHPLPLSGRLPVRFAT